jgi:hypothetical protein
MADSEDNGENLQRGIISTSRDGKVLGSQTLILVQVKADMKVPSVCSDMVSSEL